MYPNKHLLSHSQETGENLTGRFFLGVSQGWLLGYSHLKPWWGQEDSLHSSSLAWLARACCQSVDSLSVSPGWVFNELLEQHHSPVIMSPQDKLRGRGEGGKDDMKDREKGRGDHYC